MTRIPQLFPGEMTEIVPREGGPWNGDNSFDAFQRHMLREIASASDIPHDVLMRHMGLKQCLSCGAYQSNDFSLPCGH